MTTFGRLEAPRRRLVAAVALAVCGTTACSSAATTGPVPSGSTGPSIAVGLATSVVTPSGTWATVPMGYLDQPLNTFWQVFYRSAASAGWDNDVGATAVATNGGLVVASSGARTVLGVRPSHLLTFSPLIATSNGGRSWSNGLISQGLADVPDSLALGPSGRALALVSGDDGPAVLESAGNLTGWTAAASESSLAATGPGRACGVSALTAVAYLGASPAIGTVCEQPGQVGILISGSGEWTQSAPALPAALQGGRVEVLALRAAGSGLDGLLAVADGSRTDLLGAWTSGLRQPWTVSAPLAVASSGDTVSTGTDGRTGLLVLLSPQSGPSQIDTVSGPRSPWAQHPSAPPGTATVSVAPDGSLDALAVNVSVLTVWRLAPGAQKWAKSQTTDVPIAFGSSS